MITALCLPWVRTGWDTKIIQNSTKMMPNIERFSFFDGNGLVRKMVCNCDNSWQFHLQDSWKGDDFSDIE